ncbi:PD-(D/E)XK nuclease family protein [filamentous cyanobacterium CCP5]|nr:PD-(D/E)XK nuclease family protein [filamentous cyanobacterium CCP5]
MLKTLSQGHLSLLETCPRKFQHTYIDQLGSPIDPDLQERLRWGSQFHLLMQQREMGLPVAALPAEDGEFQLCIQALVDAAPELFEPNTAELRLSEQPCTLFLNGYLLTAVYDLLLIRPGRGQIIDWKTHLKPKTSAQLVQDWQTRLYLFLLVETTPLTPDQVSMSYWFVRCQVPETGAFAPQQVTIPYSLDQHRQTRAALQRLTDQLTHLLDQPQAFPQVEAAKGICRDCSFDYRCDRVAKRASLYFPPLSAVAEVPIKPIS